MQKRLTIGVTLFYVVMTAMSEVLSSDRKPRQVSNAIEPQGILTFISRPEQTVEVAHHESVILECAAVSYDGPAPVVVWMKDGKPVSSRSGSHTERQQVGDSVMSSTRSLLQLNCITPAMAGVYICAADNGVKHIKTHTSVVISENTDQSTESVDVECRRRSSRHVASPPLIVMCSNMTLTTEGLTTALFCRATGNPAPQITWKIRTDDGADLISSDVSKYEILSSGDLIIKDLDAEKDRGRYVCEAENSHGNDQAEMFLYPAALE